MRNQLVPSLVRRGGAVSGAIIVCMAGTFACGSQDPPPASQANRTPTAEAAPEPPSTPPSAADVAKEKAKAAYVGMWQAMARAGRTSDWQSPELARYATGNALTTITRSLYADHFNHVVTRGAPKNDPRVTSVDPRNAPKTVMLSDCGDSTNWLKYREGTNELVDDDPGGRQTIVAEVEKQPDGSWRVTRFAVQGVGTC